MHGGTQLDARFTCAELAQAVRALSWATGWACFICSLLTGGLSFLIQLCHSGSMYGGGGAIGHNPGVQRATHFLPV